MHFNKEWSFNGCKRAAFRTAIVLFAGLAIFAYARPATAASLQIQFTGLNLQYDGINIYDAGVHNSLGSGNPAQADPLSTMSFFVNNVLVGSVLTSDIYADIFIAGVSNIPATGGAIVTTGNGNGFGIDLLTNSSNPGYGIGLNVNSMQLFYTGSQIAISIAGQASSVFTQSLPFALVYDTTQPISIVMSSAALSNITTGGAFLTGFDSSGTGNVNGTIPEPGSLTLSAVGMVALAGLAYRRQRSKLAAK